MTPDRPPQRIFFDADALIAGSASTTGASHAILVLGELGIVEVVVSHQVVTEAERNISSKLPLALSAFRAIVEHACTVLDSPQPKTTKKFERQAHPKDVPILAAAVTSGCDSLITFNTRDFRPERGTIKIQTPGDFLTQLRNELEGLAE
ncbi:MAG: PIN domain-containing protein [Actinomycetota bacterium]